MKRITGLILAAAFIFGSLPAARAIDIKVMGNWEFAFGWAERTQFADSNRMSKRGERDDDNFMAVQRIRTQINFIASEELQGVLMFEIGEMNWGHAEDGGQLDADGVNVKTKRAFLDWMVPETSLSFRMGIQGISLPMATGYSSPVFSADVAGIVANYKFDDTFAITAFWLRPFNQYINDNEDSANRSLDDEMDLFGLTLPVTLEGLTITPWGMWGRVGSASGFYEYLEDAEGYGGNNYSQNSSATAWWVGTGIAVDMFDPLTFAIDAMYGHLQRQQVMNDQTMYAWGFDPDEANFGMSGWFITATLNYELDWGTPGLFGWWSTGDTKKGVNAGKLGRMPLVGTDDGFGPTSFGFAGSENLMADSLISGTAMGTWAVGMQITDISFIENLSHTIRLAYIQGTNEHKLVKDGIFGRDDETGRFATDGVYLTDKDHAWEVNFDHRYNIYENLTAFVELGYINLDLDRGTWKDSSFGYKTDDAWKAQVLLRYEF